MDLPGIFRAYARARMVISIIDGLYGLDTPCSAARARAAGRAPMPTIQVQFVSALVIFTKERSFEMKVPDGFTITNLLDMLHQKYGTEDGARIFETKGSMSHVLVMLVNGVDIRHEDGLETVLHDGDVVVFMPVIAGG